MKVINIHQRVISSPPERVVPLLRTLASDEDLVWPVEQWPRMRLNEGLKLGSRGGHGPIRYHIEELIPDQSIQFRFEQPKGFDGYHRLSIDKDHQQQTRLHHVIDMKTNGLGTIAWLLGIRWLHDALIEDAFDKIENQLCGTQKRTEWNWWVRTLRRVLK